MKNFVFNDHFHQIIYIIPAPSTPLPSTPAPSIPTPTIPAPLTPAPLSTRPVHISSYYETPSYKYYHIII